MRVHDEDEMTRSDRRELKETGFAGEHTPKFRWETTHEGQANYITLRCEELGIRAYTVGSAIMLYSKKRIPELLAIIEESTKYLYLPTPSLCGENLVCRHDRTILGVMVKRSNTCYTTEKHFRELKYHVYKREIPAVTNYIVCMSHKEMKDLIAEQERLYV